MTETGRSAPVTAPPTQRKAWIAGLEGPRGFGALCVVLGHVAVVFAPWIVADARIDYLGQALTFFFVLSGFLLYLPYVTRADNGRGKPVASTYFASRVRRVFPAYLVIFCIVNFGLGAAYTVNPVMTGWERADDGTGTITEPARLLTHLTLTQSLFPETLQTGINPAWSLTTEWGFYLVLPVAGWLLFALRGTRPIVAAILPPGILLVVGWAGNAAVSLLQSSSGLPVQQQNWGPNWYAILARSFFAFADTFAWGMIAAVLYAAILRGAFPGVSTARLQLAFGTLCMSAVAVSMVLFLHAPRWTASVFAVASLGFILTIVSPLGRGEQSRLAVITDWLPFRYIGTISLSVYLWHYPVIIVTARLDVPIPATVFGLLWGTALILGVSVLLGTITYYTIERPAMRWRA
ncbi:acyltransferase family protein [Rhodococcoides corynebacterioides]|nr:hypothetical protein A3Q40_03132 [Rhodococcus sp. PBTS 1]